MTATTSTDWSDPITCPFCGDELASPGAGFVDHIHDNAECENGFEHWRRTSPVTSRASGPGKPTADRSTFESVRFPRFLRSV